MKKFMKSLIKVALIAGIGIGLICVTGAAEDITTQFIWTSSWMAEIVVCGWAFKKLFPEYFKEENV